MSPANFFLSRDQRLPYVYPMGAHDADATMAVFLDLETIPVGAHDPHFPPFV